MGLYTIETIALTAFCSPLYYNILHIVRTSTADNVVSSRQHCCTRQVLVTDYRSTFEHNPRVTHWNNDGVWEEQQRGFTVHPSGTEGLRPLWTANQEPLRARDGPQNRQEEKTQTGQSDLWSKLNYLKQIWLRVKHYQGINKRSTGAFKGCLRVYFTTLNLLHNQHWTLFLYKQDEFKETVG